MRRFAPLLLLPLAACADPSARATAPDRVTVPLYSNAEGRNFQQHLTGDAETPPRETQAQGNVKFQIAKDGQSISYQLIASNIENIVASHIHLGPATCQCPVVVFLYGNAPAGGGRHEGVLAEGTITAANMIGPLAGQPLSALIDQMRAGNTYVNVHTNDGVAPTNTGPGDFPGGEVRGQIDHGSAMDQ